MAMDWLMGRQMTPQEMLRKNRRVLNTAMRDLDREKVRMDQQEKTLIAELKKAAKQGQTESVKVMAKNLVTIRRHRNKLMLSKANIQGVNLKMESMKSQNAMTNAMRGVSQAMNSMNKQMNLPQVQGILKEFQKQSDVMDMKEEIINETIDDAIGDEADEEESNQVVTQVLDELGLQLNDQLSRLNPASSSLATSNKASSVKNNESGNIALSDTDSDILTRLENLRKG